MGSVAKVTTAGRLVFALTARLLFAAGVVSADEIVHQITLPDGDDLVRPWHDQWSSHHD